VKEHTEDDTMVYTDEAAAYRGLPRPHESVKHSVSEYVREQAHTNGIESHWAALKRGYDGVYHHMSAKHLQRPGRGSEGLQMRGLRRGGLLPGYPVPRRAMQGLQEGYGRVAETGLSARIPYNSQN
jgi:hypothetical protein